MVFPLLTVEVGWKHFRKKESTRVGGEKKWSLALAPLDTPSQPEYVSDWLPILHAAAKEGKGEKMYIYNGETIVQHENTPNFPFPSSLFSFR